MATTRKRVVIYLTPEQDAAITALAGKAGVSKFIATLLIEQLALSGKPPERGKYARKPADS